ncbi:MAG: ABC transporter ATP-binding protein [Rhodospirillales bacterium]|nr:ABC transporter ATP-binding protein [Rhodospirillales bacterium]
MLEIHDLHLSYGKVRAVQGVSLEVADGEIVALIGANGAGKSSTMHAVCGIERPSSGHIRFLGRAITRMPPHRIMRRGIVQVPEGRLIFGGLTVEQNLRLGAHNVAGRAKTGADIKRVLEAFPMLRERLDEPGSALSGGQAQMLALARGLMARPRLLILDEPSLGLAPIAALDVFALIPRLRDAGVTILLVEQNVRQALAIADRGYVLESGRIILDGKAAELAEHELLVSAYLGLQRGG